VLDFERTFDGATPQPQHVYLLNSAESHVIIIQGQTVKRGRMISLPLREDSLAIATRNPDLHPHARPDFGDQGLYTCGFADLRCYDSDLGLWFGLSRHRYRYIFGHTANAGCE
jgi:hypothetical protein